MEALWFCLVAGMIAMYVVFDGFDLGAGAIHLWVAREPEERGMVLRSIGPVWDGNEVWLLAAGGTLYFAFPALYASSFSGFYLPLMVVLWLLILRGIAIEFRHHIDHPVWRPFWDVIFFGASALLAVFFGAALGNVVRGVPLDAQGWFFEPLWTDFTPGGVEAGILDWYTVLVGVAALVALVQHGALWVALKTTGAVERRAHQLSRRSWWAVVVATVAVTLASLWLQPQILENLQRRPWGAVFPLLAVGGLVVVRYGTRNGSRRDRAFLGSCAYLCGMLSSAAFGLYPYVLPALGDPTLGLTAQGTAAASYGLRVGLAWWIPGMLLVTGYFVYTYRHFGGKLTLEQADHHPT